MNKKILQGSFIVSALAVMFMVAIQSESSVNLTSKTIESSQLNNTLDQKGKNKILEAYGKTPMGFEENHGQSDAQVKFLTRGQGYTLFLTPSEAVLKMQRTETKAPSSDMATNQTLPPLILRMKLLEANADTQLEGLDTMASKSNYFIGNESQTDVTQYKKVRYNNIYPGIDLVYYGNQQRLEYDFIVEPGADPDAIQISFEGADHIEIGQDGQLNIHSSDEMVKLLKPVIYQDINGQKEFIEGSYTLADNRVSFNLAAYDTSKPLVIDPILIYSTYLDGNAQGAFNGLAIDNAGHAYIIGRTYSTNFPTTAGSYRPIGGGWQVSVTKLSTTGTSLIYSTFIGGNNSSMGEKITIDSAGNAYLVGETAASTYPTTPGAIQATSNWGIYTGFITKLNATGSALVFSSYLGGTNYENIFDLALDSNGNVYVSGRTNSLDFPVTAGAFQTTYAGGTFDGFVAKINPDATQLLYSTYIGSSGMDWAGPIAIDAGNNAIISALTDSPLYPTTAGAYQETYGGGLYDAAITKFNTDGTALIYSTFLGGSDFDRAFDIDLDEAGNIYITGDTRSTDFPVTANAYQTNLVIPTVHNYVTKLNPAGNSLIYSTYVGAGRSYAIAIDTLGRAYITGVASLHFPTTKDAIQGVIGGLLDAYVARLDASGSILEYASFLGGADQDTATDIAVDAAGNVYVVGATMSTDFPLMNPIQNTYGGGRQDGFITKMTMTSNLPPVADAGTDQLLESTGTTTVVTLNGSASSDPDATDILSYTWSGSFGTALGISPILNLSNGTYSVTLTVDDSNGATATDSVLITVLDTVAPVVSAGPDVTVEATSAAGALYDVAAQVIISDVCPVSTSISPVGTYPLGSTTVTVTATDCANNTANDQVIVTVQDSTAPVITAPASINANAAGIQTAVVTGSASATDIFPIVISSDAPTTFPVGISPVTWSTTDKNGNTATAIQIITVTDITPPVITINATGGVTASDNIDGVLIATPDQPTPTQPGTHLITWTATDAAGNTSTFVQTVVIALTQKKHKEQKPSKHSNSDDDDNESDSEHSDDDDDKDDD